MDLREIRNINKDALPAVIWDWCSRPQPEQIDSALQRFSEMNINKVFIRPSNGLVIKYLSDDFFELVRTAARRSARYGISLWICDEFGEASGIGGGEITSVGDYRMRDFVKVAPKDKEKTDEVISENSTEAVVLRNVSSLRASKRFPLANICDNFVSQCFIEEVYDEYFRQCKRFIGCEIVGFSTTVNIPSSTLYSSVVEPDAKKLSSVIFGDDASNKNEYYKGFNKALTNNFTNEISKRLKQKDMLFSVGVKGKQFISRQINYLSADVPYLEVDSNNINLVEIKMLTSICSQFNKRAHFRMKTPSYSKCDVRYFTAMFLASHGGTICYDSVPYSVSDRRKYEDNNTTLSIYAEKDISNRIARMCNLTQNTDDDADLLLVFPSFAINGACPSQEKENNIYDSFLKLVNTLCEKNISFHIADEYILDGYAKIENNCIIIGKNNYSKILLPEVDMFFDKTVELCEKIEKYEFTEDSPLFETEGKYSYLTRKDENYIYYFVTANEDLEITYKGEKPLYIVNMADGEIYHVTKNQFTLKNGHTASFIVSDEIYCDDAPPIVDCVIFESSKKICDLPFMLCEADENLLPLKTVNACFGKKSYRESCIDDLHKEFYSLNEGDSLRQISWAIQHLLANLQPRPGFIGLGTSPFNIILSLL